VWRFSTGDGEGVGGDGGELRRDVMEGKGEELGERWQSGEERGGGREGGFACRLCVLWRC
jgi:hypothetical protein